MTIYHYNLSIQGKPYFKSNLPFMTGTGGMQKAKRDPEKLLPCSFSQPGPFNHLYYLIIPYAGCRHPPHVQSVYPETFGWLLSPYPAVPHHFAPEDDA